VATVSIAAFLLPDVARFAALVPRQVVRGEVWRLVSWPFVTRGPITGVAILGMLYGIARQLAPERPFLRTLLAIILGAALLQTAAAFVLEELGLLSFGGWEGPVPVLLGLLVVWARLDPGRPASAWLPLTRATAAAVVALATRLGGSMGLLAMLVGWTLTRKEAALRRMWLLARDWWSAPMAVRRGVSEEFLVGALSLYVRRWRLLILPLVTLTFTIMLARVLLERGFGRHAVYAGLFQFLFEWFWMIPFMSGVLGHALGVVRGHGSEGEGALRSVIRGLPRVGATATIVGLLALALGLMAYVLAIVLVAYFSPEVVSSDRTGDAVVAGATTWVHLFAPLLGFVVLVPFVLAPLVAEAEGVAGPLRAMARSRGLVRQRRLLVWLVYGATAVGPAILLAMETLTAHDELLKVVAEAVVALTFNAIGELAVILLYLELRIRDGAPVRVTATA
jgi:hypothetical protein